MRYLSALAATFAILALTSCSCKAQLFTDFDVLVDPSDTISMHMGE